MSNIKRITTNTIFLYIRLLFVLVLSIFTVRIVLNSLGVEDYGIYNVVCGFVSMFGFLSTSMTNGVQRFYNFEIGKRGEASIGNVYSSALYIQIILIVVLLVIAEPVGIWYVNNKMVLPADKLSEANFLFQFSIIGLLLSFLHIPYSAAIVAHEKLNFYALVGIIDAIAKLLIAYCILLTPNRLLFYGLFMLGVNIMDFLLYVIYARHHFKELQFEKISDRLLVKDMMRFTLWNTFGSFAYVIRSQGVNVLMNSFFGVIINAANSLASQVSASLSYFSANLVLAFKPQLTQSYASGNTDETYNLMSLMTRMSYALVCTLSVPIVLEIDYILNLWLDGVVPDYTASFSILVIFSMLISCFHTPLTQIIQATGRIRTFQIVTSVIITSILPLSWICFKLGLNPNWAYWITIIVYVVNQIAAVIISRQVFTFSIRNYLNSIILRSMLFTVVLPIVPYIVLSHMSSSFMRLVVICIITVVIAVAMTYIVMLNSTEKRQILAKLSNMIK